MAFFRPGCGFTDHAGAFYCSGHGLVPSPFSARDCSQSWTSDSSHATAFREIARRLGKRRSRSRRQRVVRESPVMCSHSGSRMKRSVICSPSNGWVGTCWAYRKQVSALTDFVRTCGKLWGTGNPGSRFGVPREGAWQTRSPRLQGRRLLNVCLSGGDEIWLTMF